MIISDIIKDYPEDYNLKIGAHDGNGYFYCGTIADWKQHGGEYSESLKDLVRSRYLKSKDNCKTLIMNLCKDVVRSSEDGKMEVDDYTESLENRLVNISKAINSRNNSKKRLDNYISVNNRVVMEHFEADLAIEYPECLVILVKGTESGKFWDCDEDTGCHLGINSAAEGALMGMGVGI